MRRFVQGGTHHVLAAGRKPATALDDLAARVEQVTFDATDTATHGVFFDDAFSRHGPIDVVVVAFGVLHPPGKSEQDPDLAVEMADVNFTGAASALLHAARRMRDQGSGHLVVLSSVAGLVPRANFVYGSTKAGIDFLAQGLAASLADSPVGVTIVRPGFVRTSMTAHMDPVMFAVDPDDVAQAVVAGLATDRGVVWVPRVLRPVMALVRVLPPALARRLG